MQQSQLLKEPSKPQPFNKKSKKHIEAFIIVHNAAGPLRGVK